MNVFGDVWRETFPKNLRFCKQCLVLHSVLTSVVKRYKHKKYIPRAELEDTAALFVEVPGAPLTRLPVVRQVLFLRWINAVRVSFLKRPSWLFTPAVAAEHQKLVEWLAKDREAHRGKKNEKLVDREVFTREVLKQFHVAAMYHRVFLFAAVLVATLSLLVSAELLFPQCLWAYLRWWRGMTPQDILEYFRQVTEAHVLAFIPPAYEAKLPPPCVLMVNSTQNTSSSSSTNDGGKSVDAARDGDGCQGQRRCFHVQVTEMISPDELTRVIFVPCPQIGPRSFYERVGAIVRACDALLLEGVPASHIHRMYPALLFPLKDANGTFPAFGVHHRYYDILRGNPEAPPKLYPAAIEPDYHTYIMEALIPMTMRMILRPSMGTGKVEAKIAWGRLRELIADIREIVPISRSEVRTVENREQGDPHRTIVVPWSVANIVSLEASLVKLGYSVARYYTVPWMEEDHMGSMFLSSMGVVGSAT